MSIGVALSVRSRVRECTPALFNQVVDDEKTARVCADIEDALERTKRGEMSREDFETYKSEQKRRLAIFTPHATFPHGRRVNEDAMASGLSMYDVDHIVQKETRGSSQGSTLYERMVEHTLAKRAITDGQTMVEMKRLGICMMHVTPSTEGFRLFFIVPRGMSLEEAQRWMSRQLGDHHYDGCVKTWPGARSWCPATTSSISTRRNCSRRGGPITLTLTITITGTITKHYER